MVASLRTMANLDWTAPGYTTLCRGQKTLPVQIPYRRADGPLNLRMDNTGIKFLGDGDWQARKHGVEDRRQWRDASRLSENASRQGTQKAKPQKSRYLSHLSTASRPSAPARSFACADDDGERGYLASPVIYATTPIQSRIAFHGALLNCRNNRILSRACPQGAGRQITHAPSASATLQNRKSSCQHERQVRCIRTAACASG